MDIRVGDSADVTAVLQMFDSAVAWLVTQGRTGQWGSEPFTGNAKREEQAAGWAAGGGMRIAVVDGQSAGCLVVGPPHEYVKPVDSELYVQVLVIDQRFAGHGVGRALLERAYAEAEQLGVELLRVDCYAGDDGRLVRYYESCGFTRAEPFTVGQWLGMILQREVRRT
ncbi:GNAT family N-acetyltransferase [Nonomuraea sp. NPDC050556]|uniref:GNAT family N-acetyltransferase n=1 Tax=Nonomuraea sp. NPDC050556 TaxID=3364369 RepID=UPI0037B09B6C